MPSSFNNRFKNRKSRRVQIKGVKLPTVVDSGTYPATIEQAVVIETRTESVIVRFTFNIAGDTVRPRGLTIAFPGSDGTDGITSTNIALIQAVFDAAGEEVDDLDIGEINALAGKTVRVALVRKAFETQAGDEIDGNEITAFSPAED
jgi:hypothetical protein